MTIKHQITPKLIAWRLKKIIYNFAPSKNLRKKLQKSLPRKWDVVSFSPENMAKYESLLTQYPDVLNPQETLDQALQAGSFSRIGDGEFNVIIGGRNSFNRPMPKLAQRLKEICETGSTPNCVVCLNNYKLPKNHSAYSWFVHHGTRYLDKVLNKVNFPSQKCGDAYFLVRNSSNEGVAKIKSLWNNQKVLFVCNKKSPIIKDSLNFFEQVKQKEFLYIPDKDAFEHYDEIMADIKKYDTSWQIYLEVGATASVLAWDLSADGYHAFDMGDVYKRSMV